MYAQLRILDTGNDSADELIARLQSDVAPVYMACDGFVGYFVVGSHTNRIETVRIFDDQQTFEAATEAARAAQEQIAADLAPEADDQGLAGELVISEWA
ncbi:MAG: hypothetical protein WKF48_09590 [Solirubrobacteraceae bacterium]